VIGEPGMGKTRLVQEVLHDAAEMVVVSGPSSSYDSKTPYVAFRTLLRELLGVGTAASSEVTAQRLRDRVAANTPQLLPWLPLLGIVLDVDAGTTNETDELDERFRGPRIAEVLVEFLQVVLPTPTLLVFENTHLMDDASAELLRAVAADLDDKPWVVLATRRDVPTGFVPAEHGARYRELLLTPMDPAAALQLLDAATNTAPLSAHVMNAIAAKAAGNPLFLRALVTATLRSGSEADLPDSVEAFSPPRSTTSTRATARSCAARRCSASTSPRRCCATCSPRAQAWSPRTCTGSASSSTRTVSDCGASATP
jgi:predicted ATPase